MARKNRTKRRRSWLTHVFLLIAATLLSGSALAGVSVHLQRGEWGIVGDYGVPEVNLMCTGHFEGTPQRVEGQVDWVPLGVGPPSAFVPFEASFRVDSVVMGIQGLVGQTIRVRYAVRRDLLPDGPDSLTHEQLIGSEAYRDVTATVAGRRCLLLLQQQEDSSTYAIYHDINFMLAGQKADVAGWAEMEPMRRLEYEFASAVGNPDPVIAHLASLSAGQPYNKAVGPVLIGAMRRNLNTKDRGLQADTVRGLVRLGDLDTIYELKGIFDGWRDVRAMASGPGYVGADGLDLVRTRNAVPALVELTSYPDAGVRFGATAALRSIGGPDAVAALAGRLYDESSSVRYQAIQGLARELRPSEVGVKDWTGYAPAFKIYEQDPDTPVRNWKRWWEQKGEGKYPSVESMVTKAQRFRTERPWAHEAQPAE